MAYSYTSLFGEYSFLQYNQAGGEQGKTALLDYLGILQKIRNQRIPYPENTLHRDSALTYLRLYRLEVTANNPTKAEQYLGSAQTEFSNMGKKDASPDSLIKLIQTREANEAKLYNNDEDAAFSRNEKKP